MNTGKGIGNKDTIVARLRPDEGLFLVEMSQAFNIRKSEAIRLLVMIGRRLLQEESTGTFNIDLVKQLKGEG